MKKPKPFGYLWPKAGINNGYYFMTREDFAGTEKHHRAPFIPIYTEQQIFGLPAKELKKVAGKPVDAMKAAAMKPRKFKAPKSQR